MFLEILPASRILNGCNNFRIAPSEIQVLPHNHYQNSSSDSPTPPTVSSSPLDQFPIWFKRVMEDGVVHEHAAISLSTATPSYWSHELEANPYAALMFCWREAHQSVRVIGKVEKVSREESEAYFWTRPKGSQLGAWASWQSQVVKVVIERLKKLEKRFTSVEYNGETQSNIPILEF
ncbi:hypothetical protein F5879DRAFT_1009823 [Lentinula edodes]|nr:hypothetical protein F5879DRAFT_1009823 [Lentinula edodes]